MNDHEITKIAEWVLGTGHYALYILRDFEPDEDWDWGGSAPGLSGGEIHLIAQSDDGAIYAETTTNAEQADFIIGEAGVIGPDEIVAKIEIIEELLNALFGDQSDWPDTYAQTHGWRIR